MKNLKWIVGMVLGVMFLMGIPGPATAQFAVEVSGGAGYTLVDTDKWGSEENMLDYQVRGLGLVQTFENFSFGAELGWQHLFRYSRRTGYSWRYYYNINTTSLMAIGRINITDKLFSDLGVGVYDFKGGTYFGTAGALGYNINLVNNISIPIKIRIEYINHDYEPIIVSGATVGVAFKFSM